MATPSVYDHLRPVDADYPDGVYRVVGTDPVVLLRVGDANGRRVTTGDVVTVDDGELAGFEPAANPDANRSLAARVASVPRTLYWSVRVFVSELAAHPIPAAVAVALVAVGEFAPVSDGVAGGATFLGALVLAYVGSGRL